tara:strand:- start:1295 stop:2086 length:792 start_codon:yes stop_codon:yes gene_type:complete
MLAIISPAKTLDFVSPSNTKKFSHPSYLEESAQLIKSLKDFSIGEISSLMGISKNLAELNKNRYENWELPFTSQNAKPALLAFKGDVYQGIDVESYTQYDLTAAQKHIRILSGLYGLLRPLDLIQAYRLEMGTNLKTGQSDNLYKFWDNKITNGLQSALDEMNPNKSTPPLLINLASNEYFNAVDTNSLNARIITPTFKDKKNGKYKFISFYAKKARGLMASFIVKNRLKKLESLKEFNCEGYEFSQNQSSGDNWVFLRNSSI